MEKDFLEYATLNYRYTSEQDIEKANLYAKKMFEIIDSLKKSDDYAGFVDCILHSENDNAKIWICGMCIDMQYRKDEAITILKELQQKNDEIISGNAHMSLFAHIDL